MTWDEWEQAKREASTRMRLDQSPGAGPSPGVAPDLVVHDKVLGALGDLARELRDRVSRDGDHARAATAEAASELTADGLDLGGAMRAVHDSWITKLGTLKDACAHISNHLDYTRSVNAKEPFPTCSRSKPVALTMW